MNNSGVNNADKNKSFKKFLLLWSGELISSIGSGLTAFGLSVYVFQQTGKVTSTAIITLLAFLPSVLLNPFAGVLADRYDRRLLMILGDSLSTLGLFYILISMLNGGATFIQICIGVTISSVFTSLLEPAYRATITDLLTPEEFSKASGLVQAAGSSRYLISPILAGFLLSFSNIKLILILDICTFFITFITTFIVRKGLISKANSKNTSFSQEFKDGWLAISENKGILILVFMGTLLTFFLAFIQSLAVPMILTFSTASVAGVCNTICATGMLASSIFIGMIPIKKSYVKLLTYSLCLSGIFMALFGLRENIILISIAGFLFFATLPFANTSLDVLIRKNIVNELQGRAWGLIGFITQFGYILAYASVGFLSDSVFTPMLVENGSLSNTVGKIIGTGPGRGTAFLIIIAGFLLFLTALILYSIKSIRKLEDANV
ncbi:MFS transporter [Terrisporobacter vanillatitrophus]|uniref:MFS transporter n=1 Tax=Terrisporobacter vanillatitrophus TaxID=3058402 RepID=UPI00336919C8